MIARRALGRQHGERMRIERQHDRLPAERARRLRDRALEDRLVPEVHAVEVAEREHDARKRPRAWRQVADDPHRAAPIP